MSEPSPEVPEAPGELRVTWAWDELFLELHPYPARLAPPPVATPLVAVGGLGVAILALTLFHAPVTGMIGLVVMQAAIFSAWGQRMNNRTRRDLRLLVKLGRDRIELRTKIRGTVRDEKRILLAEVSAPRVVVEDGEPHLVIDTPDGPVEIGMRRTEPESARWLADRIAERRAEAIARLGDGRTEVPAALDQIVRR